LQWFEAPVSSAGRRFAVMVSRVKERKTKNKGAAGITTAAPHITG